MRDPERDSRRDEQRGWERYGVISQIVLAIATLVAVILSFSDRFTQGAISAQTVYIGALVALYLVSMVFIFRYLRRTRYYDCRLTITGPPAAGKTVFSILLYEHLMNGRTRGIKFTADSRAAISTYQAVRGISAGVWPPRTSTGSVLQYDGTIQYSGRRTLVDLEIGDSAGQHWISLSEGAEATSDYLQWVISAQGIVHVLSVEWLNMDTAEETLIKEVEDLKLAATLMRSTKRDSAPLSPLLVVISKVDLIPDVDLAADELMRLIHATR